jgi:hypothetical protein
MLTVLCLAGALFAGCGDSDEEQVRALMGELRGVQASGDAEKACEKVYVVRERNRAESEGEEEGGEECRRACEQAVRGRDVTNLRTKLQRVDLKGEEGTAVLHTTATRPDGSTLDRDVPYDVIRTEKGWRIRIAGE